MIFAIVTVIGVGAYMVLQKENTSVYSFPLFKKIAASPLFQKLKLSDPVQSLEKIGVVDFATSTVERGTEAVRNQIGALTDKVAQKTENILDNLIDGIKTKTFLTVKDSVDSQLQEIGTNFGVNVDQLPVTDHSPIVFGVVTGTPAYFTISNTDIKEASYIIKWQDGTEDNGIIKPKKTRTVTHIWKKSGTYAVQFNITLSGIEKNHQIVISIL
ncbi:MAG: hypothetical protein Q8R26_03615 [bacterium]|nr:hypothetical protein [bacterium]